MFIRARCVFAKSDIEISKKFYIYGLLTLIKCNLVVIRLLCWLLDDIVISRPVTPS